MQLVNTKNQAIPKKPCGTNTHQRRWTKTTVSLAIVLLLVESSSAWSSPTTSRLTASPPSLSSSRGQPSWQQSSSDMTTIARHRGRSTVVGLSANAANVDAGDEKSTLTSGFRGGASSDVGADRKRSVGVILAASFFNLLGFTMAGPITPALGQHFGLEIGASFGSLTSAYPLGMLFGLMVWPTLSDRLGRKPIITASLLGSGLGLAAQCHVIRQNYGLATFLLARALTGAFAGSSPVSKAYLADVGYKNGQLPRYLALRDAASTMAFIVGPMLGGILFDLKRRLTGNAAVLTSTESLAFVIGSSAVASLFAALLVVGLVVDMIPSSKSKQESKNALDKKLDSDVEQGNQDEIVSCPLGREMWAGVASVCLVSFLFNIGDSTFHAFFSALLRNGAGLSVGDIGLLYTGLACVSFGVSTGASSYMLQRWGPVATCAAGLACVGSGLLSLGAAAAPQISLMPPTFVVLAASASLYYCGVPMYGPTIPTMLLRCVPPHRRGAIMGLDGTINTIGRILSPLIMGEVYRRKGAGAAFGLAGSLVFGGALTCIYRRILVLRESHNTQATATSY